MDRQLKQTLIHVQYEPFDFSVLKSQFFWSKAMKNRLTETFYWQTTKIYFSVET